MFVYAAALVLVLLFLSSAVKILNEYERGVVFRLGRVIGCKGPGLILLIPAIDKMVRVDLRVVAMDVPAQDVITRDNVTIKVSAVLYFRVIDPNRAIVGVENYLYATSQLSQTTLRSVCGQAELDELLASREKINTHLQEILDKDTEPWGVKVAKVEIKNIDLPQEMQRAIAKQAEAERERRAKVIGAEGEFQAAQKLSDAAKIIGENPIALQLRYLQTLREVAAENNSTTIFPVPIDLLTPFMQLAKMVTPAPRRRSDEVSSPFRGGDPRPLRLRGGASAGACAPGRSSRVAAFHRPGADAAGAHHPSRSRRGISLRGDGDPVHPCAPFARGIGSRPRRGDDPGVGRRREAGRRSGGSRHLVRGRGTDPVERVEAPRRRPRRGGGAGPARREPESGRTGPLPREERGAARRRRGAVRDVRRRRGQPGGRAAVPPGGARGDGGVRADVRRRGGREAARPRV